VVKIQTNFLWWCQVIITIASRDQFCRDCKLTVECVVKTRPSWWRRFFLREKPATKIKVDVWYGYDNNNVELERKITGTTDGYRVQVLSTDDIDEANRVRTEIYEKTSRKEVYVIFEPPFYKVKAGDFTSKSEADDFKFKLNQLGYNEAKVIQETVNLFE